MWLLSIYWIGQVWNSKSLLLCCVCFLVEATAFGECHCHGRRAAVRSTCQNDIKMNLETCKFSARTLHFNMKLSAIHATC